MVEEDGPTDELTPARRLATRLLSEAGFAPPVPVEELAAERFDIREEFFPADWDAVVLGLTEADQLPRLVLNKDRSPMRKRFTLAHELGHSVISWHLGTIVCHTDLREEAEAEDDLDADEIHYTIEREANSFASELLMPHRWLIETFSSTPVPDAFEVVEQADVSAAAACFAVVRVLPAGHVLAVTDQADRVRYLFQTEGTDVPLPYLGEELDPPSLDAMAVDGAQIPFSKQTVHWWQFDQQTGLIASGDPRSASEILEGILDVACPENERVRLRNRINGIVGSAKNRSVDLTAEGIHGQLQRRFAHRPDLSAVQAHPDFRLFLSRKADEISDSR